MNAHADVLHLKPLPFATPSRAIVLAMSGGAAHGAFAWGVLDRLLEEVRISFAEIDATDIGAANAAVLAYGLTVGGRAGARRALQAFWRRAARSAAFSPPWAAAADRPAAPPGASSLRWALEQVVDFEHLRRGSAVPLFLSAVNLRTGRTRVFAGREVCLKGVLASASLPPFAPSVEIDGERYAAACFGDSPALLPDADQDAGIRVTIEGDALSALGDDLDFAAIDIGAGSGRDAGFVQVQALHSIGRARADAWLTSLLARTSTRRPPFRCSAFA